MVVDRDRHSPYERPPLSKRLPGTTPSLTPLIDDQKLRKLDVELICGTGVRRLGLARDVLTDGRRLPAQTVDIGVGVEPQAGLARRAGLCCADGTVVDEYGRTSDPWVFAAGDVACQPHPHLTVPGRIEHWDSALRHGAQSARPWRVGRLRIPRSLIFGD
jgi:NADPH-dependent 2,4-dienoyl-CoA reductase/sulfur reductase-like enzyme